MTLKVYKLWNVIKQKTKMCLFQIDWKNNIPEQLCVKKIYIK